MKKEIQKLKEYYPIISKDEDWDFGFLITLIEYKLKRMSRYFHTHDIVENESRYGDICDTAIRLLQIGYKEETILSEDLKDIHVNIKNIDRFFSKKGLELIYKPVLWKKYGLATVRIEKAKYLFWKYMYHYIELLWD